MLDNSFYKKESPTFTGITRGVGGFGFGAATSAGEEASGPSKKLYEVFGVGQYSSTTVRVQNFTHTYTCNGSMPTSNGWSDFPHNNYHSFFCSYIYATNNDELGPLGGYNNDYDVDGNIVSKMVPNYVNNYGTMDGGYNPNDMLSSGNYAGAWCGSNSYVSNDQGWFDIVFSSGLQNSMGFVVQGYSNNHQTMLLRVRCNNINKIFAPKGRLYESSLGNAYRHAYYPTKAPFVSNTSYFDSYTGNVALPASIFE